MMRIDIVTLFPEMCERVMNESIIGRAIRAGKLEAHCHNLRDASDDRYQRVDDCPYGGGKGMVLEAEPLARTVEAVIAMAPERPHIIYPSPKGAVFTQKKAFSLARLPRLLLVCGHYEGVDQRFLDEFIDEEISMGDYVLTGGELPALALADAVGRLCDGVLSDEQCYLEESHCNGLLEYPQYTRPVEWRGRAVPEVLLSGHHANVARWRREQSLLLTLERRPDLLLGQAELSEKDLVFLSQHLSPESAEGSDVIQ